MKKISQLIMTLMFCCVLCPANLLASDWLELYPEDWKGDSLDGNERICINWTKELTWYASGYIYSILENNFNYAPDEPTETPWLADEEGTVEDYDGNVYKTLRFGDTWWMAENLRAKTFADGTVMQKYVEWNGSCDGGYEEGNDSEFMYTHANDDANNDSIYGCLYSWGVGYSTLHKKKELLKDSAWVIPDTLDFYNLMKRFGTWKTVELKEVDYNGDTIFVLTSAPGFGLFLKSDRNTLWETGSPRAGEIPYNASGLNFPPAGQMKGKHSEFGTMATIWTAIAVHSTPNDGLGRRFYTLSNTENTMRTNTEGYGMARSLRLVKRIKRINNGDGSYTATDSIAWCPGYINGIVEKNNSTPSGSAASLQSTAAQNLIAWGAQNCIMIQCQNQSEQAEIYSINGNLAKKVKLTAGTMQVAVKPGIYIVRANGIAKKVVVN